MASLDRFVAFEVMPTSYKTKPWAIFAKTHRFQFYQGMPWIQDALERATLNLTGRTRSSHHTTTTSSSILPSSSSSTSSVSSSPSICLACAMALPQRRLALSGTRTNLRPTMTGRSVCSIRSLATKTTSNSTRGKQRSRPHPASPSSKVVDLGSWGLNVENPTVNHIKGHAPSRASSAASSSPQSSQQPSIGVANLRYLLYSTAEPKFDTTGMGAANPIPAWLRQQARDVQQQFQRRHHIPLAIVPPLSALQYLWRTVFSPSIHKGTSESSSPPPSTVTQCEAPPLSPLQQQNLESLTSADWGLWIMWLWHHGDYATLSQMHELALERPMEVAARIPDEGLVLLTEARIRHLKTQLQHQHQQDGKTNRSRRSVKPKESTPSSPAKLTEGSSTMVQWIEETVACIEKLGRRPLVELYELWIQEAFEAQDWQLTIEASKAIDKVVQQQRSFVRRPRIQAQVELVLAYLGLGDVHNALSLTERALVDASLMSSTTTSSTSTTSATVATTARSSERMATQSSKPNDRWHVELARLRRELEAISDLNEQATMECVAGMTTPLYPLLLDALSSGEQDLKAAQRATNMFHDWLGQLQPSTAMSSSHSYNSTFSSPLSSTMDPVLFHKLVRFVGVSAGSGGAETLIGHLSMSLDAMRDGGSKLSDFVSADNASSSSSSKAMVKKDKKQSSQSSPSPSSNNHQSAVDTQAMALRTLANIGCQEVLVQALREGEMDRAKRMFQVLGSSVLQPSSLLSSWTGGSLYGSSSRLMDTASSPSLLLWLTPVQNGLYDTYLDALVAEGDYGHALTVLQKMLVHDRVPMTSSLQRLISGMVKSGQLVEALGVYRELTEVFGVKPTPPLLHTMLNLAAKEGDLTMARKIRRMLVDMDKMAHGPVENESSSSPSLMTASATAAGSASASLSSSTHSGSHNGSAMSQLSATQLYNKEVLHQQVDMPRLYHDLMTCYMNRMNIPGAFRTFEAMGHAGVKYEIRHINVLLEGTMAKGRVPLPDTTVGILEVMTTLGLQPNVQTYRALFRAALLNHDRPLAERWFKELAASMLSGKEQKKVMAMASGINVNGSNSSSGRKTLWSTVSGAFDQWRAARHRETFELLMSEYVRMYGSKPAVRLLEGVLEGEVCVPSPNVLRMLMSKSCDEGQGGVGYRVFELMKQMQTKHNLTNATTTAAPATAATLPVAGGPTAYLTSQASDLALYHRLVVQLVEGEQDIDRGQAVVTELIVSGVMLNETLVEDAIGVYAQRLDTARAALGIFSRMKRAYGIRTPTPKMLAVVDQLSRKIAAAADAATVVSARPQTQTPSSSVVSCVDVDQLSSSASA
ncbi:hypothetical protein BGW42_007554 [Actinomortierella wolfii]|nr:hypothetical protein BGW42_007554 [Actinomortierella wolfii]